LNTLATNYANLAQNYDKMQSKSIEVKETLRDYAFKIKEQELDMKIKDEKIQKVERYNNQLDNKFNEYKLN